MNDFVHFDASGLKHLTSKNSTSVIFVRLSGMQMTDLGTEYLGSQSVSLSGGECQSWDSPGSAYPQLGNNSFCRNSGSRESGPWCYLNAEEDLSEICDVPFCKRKLRDCKHL